MGFLSDQQGIMNRYLRETEGWNFHAKKTKKFIIGRIRNHDFQSISFLGSGWLLDIPLDELTKLDKKIILYDINHPRQVKHKIGNIENAEFRETDLTGGLVKAYYDICKNKNKKDVGSELIHVTRNMEIPQIEGDIVVSLNIMDQLDGLLIEFLKSKTNLPEATFKKLRELIQKNHLRLLKKHRSLLITDTKEIVEDKEGSVSNPLLFIPLPIASYKESWKWEFDTSGTYYKNKKTIFNVVALEL